jgi:hypothetical protein
MEHRPARRLPGLAILLLSLVLAASSAIAESKPVRPDFPEEAETCLGMEYDADHLASHPRQKVTEIFLFRSLNDDPEQEKPPVSIEGRVAGRSMSAPVVDDAPHDTKLHLLVGLRGTAASGLRDYTCTALRDGRLFCSHECATFDSLSARLEVGNLLFKIEKEDFAFPAHADCGAELPESRRPRRKEHPTHGLARLPISACHAARNRARPNWVTSGPPLRDTFAMEGARCFKQKWPTRKIRAATLVVNAAPKPEYDSLLVPVTARFTLASGVLKTLALACRAGTYAFDCSVDDAKSPASFWLTRRGARGMTLRRNYYGGGGLADMLGIRSRSPLPPIAFDVQDASACKID